MKQHDATIKEKRNRFAEYPLGLTGKNKDTTK